MTRINTKKADRRELSFNCTGCLKAELDRIEAAHRAGTLTATGNWTPAQGLEHCARWWKAPLDGFPSGLRPPWVLKVLVRLFFKKRAVAGATAPAGMKTPKMVADHFEVGPEAGFDESLAHLREQIARTDAGERFTHPSPLFGRLTHDEWLKLGLGHCQSHLGFMHPG